MSEYTEEFYAQSETNQIIGAMSESHYRSVENVIESTGLRARTVLDRMRELKADGDIQGSAATGWMLT